MSPIPSEYESMHRHALQNLRAIERMTGQLDSKITTSVNTFKHSNSAERNEIISMLKDTPKDQLLDICNGLLAQLSISTGEVTSQSQTYFKNPSKKLALSLKRKLAEFNKKWDLFSTAFAHLCEHQRKQSSPKPTTQQPSPQTKSPAKQCPPPRRVVIQSHHQNNDTNPQQRHVTANQVYIKQVALFQEEQLPNTQIQIPLRLDIESISNTVVPFSKPPPIASMFPSFSSASPSYIRWDISRSSLQPHPQCSASPSNSDSAANLPNDSPHLQKDSFNRPSQSPTPSTTLHNKCAAPPLQEIPKKSRSQNSQIVSTFPVMKQTRPRFRPILPKPSGTSSASQTQVSAAPSSSFPVNVIGSNSLNISSADGNTTAKETAATVNKIEKQHKTGSGESLRQFFQQSGAGWWLGPGRPLRGFSRKKREYDGMIRCFRVEAPARTSHKTSERSERFDHNP